MANSTDYSLSLMDMLCAAMGGVALMVFLFAAMRKNLEQQDNVGSVSVCTLVIMCNGNANHQFYVNREIGFCIFDAQDEENVSYINEKGLFTINPCSFPSPSFRFAIVDKKPEQMKIKVWLRDLPEDGALPNGTVHYQLWKDNVMLAEGDLDKNYIGVSKDSFSLE